MPDAPSRPDVVFVLSDQHRASALGCSGEESVRTPALDRLAAEGTRFTRAYATTPVCAPSRASLLTGLFPSEAGVPDNGSRLADDATTIGEAFSAAGYRTAYVGKWHLLDHAENYAGAGAAAADHVLSRGFDDAFVPEAAHEYFDVPHFRDGETRVETTGYAPTAQTDAALEFLDGADDRPTCLVVSYGPPHNPYEQVPDEFRDLYDPADISLRPNVAPILPYADDHPEPTPLWAPPVSDNEPDSAISDRTYVDPREGFRDYYAEISAVDREVGRLLDGVDERDAAGETLVVYASDHGDQLWSQGHGQKSVPYEESIRVPLIVRWPGVVPADRESDALVGLVDLAPTLYGLAGVDPPGGLSGEGALSGLSGEDPTSEGPSGEKLSAETQSGEDLSPLVRGESEKGRDAVPLVHYGFDWCGVRTDRYTYAKTARSFPHLPDGAWLLFDNVDDPYQLRNRLYDADYADVRAGCDRRVDEFLARIGDSFGPDGDAGENEP